MRDGAATEAVIEVICDKCGETLLVSVSVQGIPMILRVRECVIDEVKESGWKWIFSAKGNQFYCNRCYDR